MAYTPVSQRIKKYTPVSERKNNNFLDVVTAPIDFSVAKKQEIVQPTNDIVSVANRYTPVVQRQSIPAIANQEKMARENQGQFNQIAPISSPQPEQLLTRKLATGVEQSLKTQIERTINKPSDKVIKNVLSWFDRLGKAGTLAATAPISVPLASKISGKPTEEVSKDLGQYIVDNYSGKKDFLEEVAKGIEQSNLPTPLKITSLAGVSSAGFGNPIYFIPFEKLIGEVAKFTATKKVLTPIAKADLAKIITEAPGGKNLSSKIIDEIVKYPNKRELVEAAKKGELYGQETMSRFKATEGLVKPESSLEFRTKPSFGSQKGFSTTPIETGEFLTEKNPAELSLSKAAISKFANIPPLPKLPDQSLIQEAKKYKSAEEFVKAQVKKDYVSEVKQTTGGDIAKVGTYGEAGSAKTSARRKLANDITNKEIEIAQRDQKLFDTNKNKTNQQLQKQINDSKKCAEENNTSYPRSIQIKDEIIKTKSQLTDIWNKAQAQKLPEITPKTPQIETKTPQVGKDVISEPQGLKLPKIKSGKEQLAEREQAKLERQKEQIQRESLTFPNFELEDQYQRFRKLATPSKLDEIEDATQLKEKIKTGKNEIDNILYSQTMTENEVFDKFKERRFLESEPLTQIPKETKAIVAEKARQTIRTTKEILDRRRYLIKATQKQFGLSDADLKTITQKDIRLMSNFEFKKFLDDIRVKSEKFAERQQAENELIAQIKEKNLNIEPLRKALQFPKISNMSVSQLKEFDKLLEPYMKGDVFLGQRKLETIERTELDGIKTYREARERLAIKLGVDQNKLNNIKVTELDRVRGKSALSERNPFYKMMVEETARLELIRDAEYLEIEETALNLAKNIKTNLVNKFIPQQKNIVKWFDAEDKSVVRLTKEEAELAKFMQDEWSKALDYLIKNNALNKGINSDNYFTHIRRNVLEAIKEDGVVQAFKEIFDQYKLDEQNFDILNRETGEILALDKFFRFALKRTGELKPSENVVRAFLSYMRTFKRKQALDEIVPLIDIYASALTPKGLTKEGLLLHGNLVKFTKEWLNTQKGRRVSLIAKQGGAIEWALRSAKVVTTLLDLGLNIPVSLATQIGEQAVTYQLLGKYKYVLAKIRALTPKGKLITKKYKNFIGKNPWKELIEPAKPIGERLSQGLFSLFQDANIRRTKNFLLGSLTKEEFRSGVISSNRLAGLKTDLGRYAMVDNAKSIIGATPEAAQFTQYKSWALPILRTTLKNVSNLSKLFAKDKTLGKKALLELYRMLELTGFAVVLWSLIGHDENDDSFIGKLKQRAYTETFTLLQAINPTTFFVAPRNWKFLEDLSKNITSLVKLEEYKTSKFGEYKAGDLAGLNRLINQLTPRAIKQFDTDKQKTIDDIKKEILQQIESGEISVGVGKKKFTDEVKNLELSLKEKRFKLAIEKYKKDLSDRIKNEEISVSEGKDELAEYIEKNKEVFDNIDESSFIDKIKLYAQAIGTDPITAFYFIFSGEKIRRLDNGTIIVYRMPVEKSQQIKKELGATKDLILDHTIPLELGGSNSEKNLKLVPVEDWENYTIIENYLGDKLRAGLITGKEAKDLIIDFKNGKITEKDIIK